MGSDASFCPVVLAMPMMLLVIKNRHVTFFQLVYSGNIAHRSGLIFWLKMRYTRETGMSLCFSK